MSVVDSTPGLAGPVVVGIDGTPRSVGALRWAAVDRTGHPSDAAVARHLRSRPDAVLT